MRTFSINILLFLLCSTGVLSQVRLKGYMDNRFFFTNTKDESFFANIRENILVGNYNRIRGIAEANPSDNTYLHFAVDYFTFYGDMQEKTGIVDPRENPVQEKIEQITRVDRAYMELHLKKMDITVGMQKIAWGKSLLWSPFDAFKRVNFYEPGEERRGINAVKTYIPLSSVSGIECVYIPESTPKKSRGGLRFTTNHAGTDLAVSAIRNRNDFIEQNIAGFEAKGEYAFGWWLEYAYLNENEILTSHKSNYFKSIIGIDYTFSVGSGLYVMGEYFHDSSGSKHKQYDYLQILRQGKFTQARDYIFSTVQYNYSMYTTFQVSAISNLNDGSTIIIPNLKMNILPQVDVIIGTNAFFGKEGGEFKPQTVSESLKFSGSSQFYVWTKVHF
ncbi:hypothetical protein KAS50_01735 [bacterium]|nr:hypothetical protein [bacterium]